MRIFGSAAFFLAVLTCLTLASPAFAATPYVINGSGGDCPAIGTWNAGSLTCTLNRDVTVSGSAGIEITANNITLDGAGHTVTGDGATNAAGIEAGSNTGITIKNSIVQHFQDGIYFGFTGSSTITGNTATLNFRTVIPLPELLSTVFPTT